MLNIRTNRKSLFIALYLHLFIYTAYLTTKFIIDQNLLFPFLDIEWLPISIETWLMTVIPALILVKLFEKELYISLKDMFTHKIKLKTFLWYFIPILLYFVIGFIGKKYFNLDLIGHQLREFTGVKECLYSFSKVGWWILVHTAIPEEMMNRALMLNAFMGNAPTKNREVKAIIISSILFALTHFPSYIFVYKYSIPMILSNFITIFVIGCIFGTMFLKSKNIIFPILMHCLWDAVMYTFFT